MNNSKIALDNISLTLEEVDNTELLREKESHLVRIIEVIGRIKESEDWNVLKSLVLDSLVENLDKRLKSGAEQLEVNVPELNQLQGQLIWARRYADLEKLVNVYRLELSALRKLTQPTER